MNKILAHSTRSRENIGKVRLTVTIILAKNNGKYEGQRGSKSLLKYLLLPLRNYNWRNELFKKQFHFWCKCSCTCFYFIVGVITSVETSLIVEINYDWFVALFKLNERVWLNSKIDEKWQIMIITTPPTFLCVAPHKWNVWTPTTYLE